MAGVKVDDLARTIEEGLKEYGQLTAEAVKKGVKNAGNTVKKNISENAPKRTGEYAKSWTVTKTKETANGMSVVVRSKNRYQIAHLLENGHAKRNGGRVGAIPHITSAAQKGEEELVKFIEKEVKR